MIKATGEIGAILNKDGSIDGKENSVPVGVLAWLSCQDISAFAS